MAKSEGRPAKPTERESPVATDPREQVELAGIVEELPANKKQALIRVLAVSRTEAIWSSLPPRTTRGIPRYSRTQRTAS